MGEPSKSSLVTTLEVVADKSDLSLSETSGAATELPVESSNIIMDMVSGLSNFLDNNAIWFIPFAIVLYQLILKITIGNTSEREKWETLIYLPTDICILSIAFLASIIMTDPTKVSIGIISALFVFLIITALSFYIAKSSPIDLSSTSMKKAKKNLAINSLLSLLLLVYSAAKLLGA
ncbi:hypothetical protein [Aliivibrio sifiae]|uniref:Uncharacterized protein n=1 Tax=Aliivibrio sifiae TaxID=566293 RepID=A0A2S7X7Y7_9GAMM|nr:hypothetical protein [Aliivibrio sifiae]PQJ87474.1 hypothetical protein BTO23_15305 [Aliivibrio sifiae]GLR77195.1 hypothetical protein GCM10007855_40700 [Aliivibrio sifiae]